MRTGRRSTRHSIDEAVDGGREPITSRANPLVRRLRTLRERAGEEGSCLLEGVKLIEAALAAEVTLTEVAASPSAESTPRGRSLLGELARRRVPVRWLEDRLLASISEMETSQGVLALARRPTFEEERLYRGVPLLLVLAGIQNPGNVGALLRAAEGAGATGVYLLPGTADPFSWKALRGAMGSAFRLPHCRVGSADELTGRLRSHRVPLAAAVLEDGQPYHEADLRGPIALIIGSEGGGLSPEWLRLAERRLFIPMAGPLESLNVAVAAGVLLFEAARQRRAASRVGRGPADGRPRSR